MTVVGFFNEPRYNSIINDLYLFLKDICSCDIVDYKISRFNDDEIDFICNNCQFDFLVILHSLDLPFSNFELLLLKIQKCIPMSKNIILIITYLPYIRQNLDKTLGDKNIAFLLSSNKIIKIIIFDPHSFNLKSKKVKILRSIDIFYYKIKELLSKKIITEPLIILPDKSSLIRNKEIIDKLNIDYVLVDKTRSQNGSIINLKFSNFLLKKDIIIIDDIIDTGNTIVLAIKTYLDNISTKVFNPEFNIFCTHGVFSKLNCEILDNNFVKNIYLSPSLKKFENKKISYVDVSVPLSKIIIKLIKNGKKNC